MEKILLVADDVNLLSTRAAVLATTNIEVASCTSREFAAHARDEKFDVVVLCHSLDEVARCAVMKNVRERWPGVRTLQIFKHFVERSAAECGTDAVTTAEPRVVIDHVMKLLGRPRGPLESGGLDRGATGSS